MRLGGLQKTTTLDFPGLIGAVVFTQGCNYTCPYCHNPDLVRLYGQPLAEEEVLDTLRQRRCYLDGVVISGGEPTLQPDLAVFCKKLKGMGYQVKLDTNGSAPEVVSDLIDRKLIDYLALDLKSDLQHYPPEMAPVTNTATNTAEAVRETLALVKRSTLPHEFRTTAAVPFVTPEIIVSLAKAAAGTAPLYLQPYKPGRILNPEYMAKFIQPTLAILDQYRLLAQPYLPTSIR